MSYETPQVTDLGSLLELTQQTQTGTVLDATFTSGTPISQITLS